MSSRPSLFDPGRADVDAVRHTTVERRRLLERLQAQIEDSVSSGARHYKLLIGPHGIGKSHVLALLGDNLRGAPGLAGQLVTARLGGDPWEITSALHLFRAIARAIADAEGDAELRGRVDRLSEMPRENAEAFVRQLIVRAIGDRTLLLLVEGLDEILDALGESGQKTLRAFLQQERCCSIVATARRTTDSLSDQSAPFYGFFTRQEIGELSADGARELVTSVVALRGEAELSGELASEEGGAVIAAMHTIAGGNPRFFVRFAMSLTTPELRRPRDALARCIDELTPWVRERMTSVSRQQRMLVAHLASRRGAAPVKHIARDCFVSEQTASSQLRDLRDAGVVVDQPLGRETFYELRDPLLGLALAPGAADDTLDFLVAWYGPADPRWESSLRELALADDPSPAVRELIGEASRCGALPQLARAAVASLNLVLDTDRASVAVAERWRAIWAEAPGGGELGVAARIIDASTRARAEGSERALFELAAAERRLSC